MERDPIDGLLVLGLDILPDALAARVCETAEARPLMTAAAGGGDFTLAPPVWISGDRGELADETK